MAKTCNTIEYMEISEERIYRGTSFDDIHKAQEKFILNSNEYVDNLTFIGEEISFMMESVDDRSEFFSKMGIFYLDIIEKINNLISIVEENSAFIERHIPLDDVSSIYSKRVSTLMYLTSYKKILIEEINK